MERNETGRERQDIGRHDIGKLPLREWKKAFHEVEEMHNSFQDSDGTQ